MADSAYDNVPVRVVRNDEQGVYQIGVVVDGVFLTFAGVKLGHVDELVERAHQEQAEQQQQQAESEPQPESQPEPPPSQ